MPVWAVVATIGAGYLVGSLSPAYFFGRWLKGIDIRDVGRRHAGASNVYMHVNHAAGLITAAFDVAKGASVAMASRHCLGADLVVAYLGGFAAVAGHIFPFYLGFRGGRGAATSAGLLMLSLSWLMLPDPRRFLREITVLAIVVVVTLVVTRNDYLLATIVSPLLAYFLLARYYPRPEAVASAIIAGYVFVMSLVHYLKEGRPSVKFFWKR